MNQIFFTALALLVLSSVSGHTQTQNYQPLGILARCQVIQVTGSISSYLPPKVGDILVIDMRRSTLNDITFQSRNMIPLSAVLIRQPASRYTTHLATFQYETRTSTGAAYNTTLQIGRFSDSQIRMTIQQISRPCADGLWSMGQVLLNCRS